jgi:hypothetical protein
MKNLYSINAASQLLEKDRATITRALRGVPRTRTKIRIPAGDCEP